MNHEPSVTSLWLASRAAVDRAAVFQLGEAVCAMRSFCSSSYDQLKTKIDHLMNSASQVVEDSSCT